MYADSHSENKNVEFGQITSRIAKEDVDLEDSIVFVGDIMLGRHVEELLKTYGQKYPFSGTEDLLGSRYIFGNFEASIPQKHKPTPNNSLKLSVDKKNLDSLVLSRFTHLSLANNHSDDFGEEGFLNTTKQLKLRGFTVLGHGNEVSTSSVSYLSLGGDDLPVAAIALNATYGYPPENYWRNVIERAKLGSELQIVYIHWGDEYFQEQNKIQRQFAQKLIDTGVDVVIGHHPHVVQGIETYKNKLIFYSLGNFVFDQYFNPDVQTGLVFKLKLLEGKLVFELHPVNSEANVSQPTVMLGGKKADFLQNLSNYSSAELKDAIESGLLVQILDN